MMLVLLASLLQLYLTQLAITSNSGYFLMVTGYWDYEGGSFEVRRKKFDNWWPPIRRRPGMRFSFSSSMQTYQRRKTSRKSDSDGIRSPSLVIAEISSVHARKRDMRSGRCGADFKRLWWSSVVDAENGQHASIKDFSPEMLAAADAGGHGRG